MPDDSATTAADAATEAARIDILAAIQATAPGAAGHGAIRLRDPADRPPAAIEEPGGGPAQAEPQPRAGHGTIRLRGSTP
jgi:hypothetical protein